MQEFFVDREHILFCKGADGKDLAVKILELKNNPDFADKIANNGYQLFKAEITSKKIGETFKNILLEL
jgi:glycosyltransferase involved in cell wall biosynthesis